MKKFQVAGIDGPCVDLAVSVDAFPQPNGTMRVNNVSWQGGGKVATGMVAAARLGAKCAIMGAVGADNYGMFCVRDFEAHGIDVSGLEVQEEKTTSLSIVISDKQTDGRSIVYHLGTAQIPEFEDMDASILENCEYFFVSSLPDSVVEAAKKAKAAGAKIFIDADSYSEELAANVGMVDVFVGSEFVYEAMFGDDKNYEQNCEKVRQMGPEIVVFTFGANGCVGLSDEGFFTLPSFRVDVIDTVGAGDVFHGAFIAGLLQGWSVKEICRFASAVSAIKITRQGGRAGIPDKKTVMHFLETGEIDYTEIDKRVAFYGRSLQYV